MKARAYPFYLNSTCDVTMADVIEQLQRKHAHNLTAGKTPTTVFVGERDGYLTGILLTARDNKSYLQMKQQGGDIEITMNLVDPGQKLLDFSLFVLSPATYRGIYLSYRGSYSTSQFFKAMERLHRKAISKVARDRAKAEKKKVRDELERVNSAFEARIIMSARDFRNAIARAKSIKWFEMTHVGVLPIGGGDKPLEPYVDVSRERFTFKPGAFVAGVSASLDQLMTMMNPKNAKAGVIDLNDEEAVLSLVPRGEALEEVDTDKLNGFMPLQASTFNQSQAIATLIDIANRHKALIEYPEA